MVQLKNASIYIYSTYEERDKLTDYKGVGELTNDVGELARRSERLPFLAWKLASAPGLWPALYPWVEWGTEDNAKTIA